MNSGYTFSDGRERVRVCTKEEALELCVSGSISESAQVTVHSSLGNRTAPISHFEEFYKSVLQSKGIHLEPRKKITLLMIVCALLFTLCCIAAVGLIFADLGADVHLVRRLESIAGFLLMAFVFYLGFRREQQDWK